ncbi:MAG: SRPBCC domain-containing protein [Vicinamibacterales bacterium]
MTDLSHHLDRTILIHAPRDTVFAFFTDSRLWASWWGDGSSIDPTPGGAVYIRYPNGVEASGEVIDVEAPARMTFSFGFVTGQPIPPGGSRVSIRLTAVPQGTELTLRHEFAEAGVRDEFVQGWRYQLARFGNVVADRQHAGAAATIDRWFTAWNEPDASARLATLEATCAPAVSFRDRFGFVDGVSELAAHVEAARRFMPGLTLGRRGEVRHVLGWVLTDWSAVKADGTSAGQGTDLFRLDADGRIAHVTGFWQ